MNLRWVSEGEAHSLKLQVHVSEHSTSRDPRAAEQATTATTATVTCSSGAESNCTAIRKSEDTPPAIHLMSKDVTSFTRPYPTLVLLVINTGVRRPGYKAGCLSQDRSGVHTWAVQCKQAQTSLVAIETARRCTNTVPTSPAVSKQALVPVPCFRPARKNECTLWTTHMAVFSVTTVVAEWDFKLRCIQQHYMCFVIYQFADSAVPSWCTTASQLLLLENGTPCTLFSIETLQNGNTSSVSFIQFCLKYSTSVKCLTVELMNIPVTWQSHDSHMAVTWQSNTVACPSNVSSNGCPVYSK